MDKINYDNFLQLFLQDLKAKYNTETKREALMEYFKDFVQDMAEEAERQGKTRESFVDELQQEMIRFELKKLKDPEMSSCYQQLLMMLNGWNGKD